MLISKKVTTRAIKRQAKVDLKSQSTIKIKTRQKWRPSRTMIRQSSAPSSRPCQSSSSRTTCRYNIFAIMIITVKIMMQYGTYRNQCSNDYSNCHSYYYYHDWDHWGGVEGDGQQLQNKNRIILLIIIVIIITTIIIIIINTMIDMSL